MQHRPCSSVVNPNLIFNYSAKIKTCLNKRNTYRIGTNDILKCAANGLLLLVVDTATLRHKLMRSRAKKRSDDFGSPDVRERSFRNRTSKSSSVWHSPAYHKITVYTSHVWPARVGSSNSQYAWEHVHTTCARSDISGRQFMCRASGGNENCQIFSIFISKFLDMFRKHWDLQYNGNLSN